MKILDNIEKLYNNVKSDKKTRILSTVTYSIIKDLLKNTGFKFTNIKFNNDMLKRINGIFNLNSYKRSVRINKKKLNKIVSYLDYYSRESS